MILEFPSIKVLSKHIAGLGIYIFLEIGVLLFSGSNAHFIDFLIFYSIEITFFYLNAYWLLPLLSRKAVKMTLRIVILTTWIAAFCSISHLIKWWLLRYYGQEIPVGKIWTNWYLAFWRYLFLFGLSSSLWYARYSIQKLRKAKDQELEIIKAREAQSKLEIALLRTQLNPHLMFNALSGIHSYVYLKSPEAAEIIIKLTKVIEASLKGSNTETIATLGDEISLLQDLIELHRSIQTCYLDFSADIPSEVLVMEFPPNLLSGLLENVFKHGMLSDSNMPARFSLHYSDRQLKIESHNRLSISQPVKGFGIGLGNIKERLIKHFPNKHSLSINSEDQDIYSVQLTITV
ncbi:Sensor histidine kinase YehU [compost metagenome]